MLYNTTMNISYQGENQAQNFQNFLASEDGQFQKKVVITETEISLNNLNFDAKILDLGCGPGWLTDYLQNKGYSTVGVDAGEAQIALAQKLYPKNKFILADPQVALPFKENEFDAVVASLVICDFENQDKALNEIFRVLKPGGVLVNILPNPYYTMPVMSWKKSLWAKIFKKPPTPQLSPYFNFFKSPREFKWRNNLTRRFYSLSEQINNILAAGFILTNFREPKSETDTKNFSRQYQLYRFPLYLVLEAKKPSP